MTHFFAVKPCRFLVALNPLPIPSSLVIVSYWVVMSVVAIFSMLLDVTTSSTSIFSRFGIVKVDEMKFTTTSSLS